MSHPGQARKYAVPDGRLETAGRCRHSKTTMGLQKVEKGGGGGEGEGGGGGGGGGGGSKTTPHKQQFGGVTVVWGVWVWGGGGGHRAGKKRRMGLGERGLCFHTMGVGGGYKKKKKKKRRGGVGVQARGGGQRRGSQQHVGHKKKQTQTPVSINLECNTHRVM